LVHGLGQLLETKLTELVGASGRLLANALGAMLALMLARVLVQVSAQALAAVLAHQCKQTGQILELSIYQSCTRYTS
jgi:hypothetical protein